MLYLRVPLPVLFSVLSGSAIVAIMIREWNGVNGEDNSNDKHWETIRTALGGMGASKSGLRLSGSSKSAFSTESPRSLEGEEENLRRIIENAESILNREPVESLQVALKPILNDLRASYNVIRRRDRHSPSLADYRATWAVVASIAKRLDPEPVMSRASKGVRPKLARLIRTASERYPGTDLSRV